MKKAIIIIGILVVVIAGVLVGLWLNHNMVTDEDVRQYNTCASTRAYASNLIGSRDILILNSIKRDVGGDSKAEFYIYRLPSGVKADDYLGKKASEIGDELEQMGTATCIFIGDDPTAINSLRVSFLR